MQPSTRLDSDERQCKSFTAAVVLGINDVWINVIFKTAAGRCLTGKRPRASPVEENGP